MKRKLLLFLMLMALFAPLAMNGQTRSELTVANEGGTNYNSYVPIEGLFSDDNFQHTQIIYPASMLTAMQGGRITKLTFYLGESQETATLGSTYQLRLGTTSQTEFSTGTVNYLTTVSSSAICSLSSFTVSANGTVVFDFSSSPYLYTSGSLVVDVRLTTKASGYKTTYFLGETGSIYYSAHSRDSSSVPTSGTAYSFMPKTTFTYISSTPNITLAPATATVITGSTETLTATYGNVSGTPTITYRSSDTSVATVSGSGTTATVTGVAPGTATITATMNGSYTATCAITVEDPSYCTPNPTSVDGVGITSLTFGSGDYVVNNSNSNGLPASSPYYGDYTSMVGSSEAGETVTVTITYSTGSSTVYSYGTIIWVDWNKNYEFEDSEIVFTGTSAQGSSGTPQVLNATFTVPATQAADDYRMRIAGADSYFDNYIGGSASANHSPCFSSTYAVCHDYTLRVNSASNCPAPTNLAVSNITPNSANVSWDGEADSYNVRYRTVTQTVVSEATSFFENFDNSGYGSSSSTVIPSGWTSDAANYSSNSTDWSIRRFNNATAHSGSYFISSRSFDGSSDQSVDNRLVTPQVTLDGTLKFWMMDDGTWHDYIAVYVSTDGNNFSLIYEPGEASDTWTEVSIDLSSYAGQQGYILIRHLDEGKDLIGIDDFGIYIPTYSYTYGAWQYATSDGILSGLSPETLYEVQVQADCGTDGESGWSASETFTTPDACTVPTNLTAEVTGIAANLSWTGVQENYNVQYREYDPTAPATIILNVPSDIWNDGSGYQMLLDADATAYGDVFTATSGWTATDYSAFEYLIPTEAECSADATHFVFENSVSIQIPAGTYDWCIVNPSPGDKIYIAASNGNVGGRQDNYVFEAGKTYEFVPSLYGQNDGVDVTITADWTLVEDVTNPYMLENLSAETTYEFQVQGAGCDNWSASATFTTGIAPYEITASANPTEGGTVEFLAGTDAGATTNTHLPTDSYFKYGLTQEIYTPAEIGGGTINSIAFYCETTSNVSFTRTYDIYMVHTDKTVFANGNDWIPVTNSDRVFTGPVTYTPGEWTTINFTTSFEYDGVHNLALVMDDNTNDFTSGNYLKCRVFTPSTDGFCSMNVHSDDTDYDPTDSSHFAEYTAGTNTNFDDGMMKVKNLIKVNGSVTRTFPADATCTLVATPNTDYRFVDWTEDDEQVSTDATYSFTVADDRTLVANFEPNSHTVTIVPNNTDYGSVSQGTVVNVPHGATITTSGNTLTVNGTTVSANPAQATGQYTYAFSDWSNVPATVTEDVTITAIFTQTVNSYTVIIEPNDATYGSVSQGSVTSVPYGTTITTSDNTLTVGSTTVTATPQASTAQYTYAFSSWSNVTETVTGNVTITANFTQTTNSYNLTLIADPTAGGTVSGGGTYNYGEEVTITATAELGYTFGSWSDNGAQSHTVTITGDATYTATFTQNEYTLTLTADPTEGGTVSASPAGPYHYNDVVTVTATPNDGFNFGSWSDGGAQSHTVTITDDTELIAYFGADQTLTTYVNPIEGGYVTIAENQVSTIGAVTVGDGSDHNNVSPFTSNNAYSFEECIYTASEINLPLGCTITSISYECTNGTSQSNHIEVFMKHVDYATFSGTKTNPTYEAVTDNDKVFDGIWTITAPASSAKPDAIWNTIILDKPFVYDGTSNLMIGIHESTAGIAGGVDFSYSTVSNSSAICFSSNNKPNDMVPTDINDLKNGTLHERDKSPLRANVRLGFGTYHNGQSVTLTAHANEGYQFVNWTENDAELGTSDTYTVTMDGNHAIYANFERLAKRFITAGDWNVANNWSPTGAPTIEEDVYIEAAATIPSGCVATANEINITTGSITIADGGQLQHNNTGVSLTAQKEITGYTSENAGTNWNYYLFSSPVDNIAVSNVTGLQTTPHYDLYKFVSNNVESGNLLEWVPVGDNGNLVRNEGYIYASRTDTRIEITGTVLPSNTTISNTLTYNDGYRFGGWNLIGNPFVCNAYATRSGSDINYYVLNHQSNYDEFVPASSSDPVAPLSALMVQATAANQSVTYSRTAPSKGAGILNIDVNRTMDRSTTLLDRARVRFGEGEGLQKFQFNPNHTKVYIPEGDKDFAVYYAQGAGTIPVNFKAEDNGRYTLDFSTEEIGFNYLHLIDNRNGNDVDLLQTPYYAFDAKSTDFASRFTLVFATGNDNDGSFAFFNNGVWIINNDGKAELQVVDALGRILSSETISGSCSKAINAAPGVYMLRLINGNDVKVQKVVVKR